MLKLILYLKFGTYCKCDRFYINIADVYPSISEDRNIEANFLKFFYSFFLQGILPVLTSGIILYIVNYCVCL